MRNRKSKNLQVWYFDVTERYCRHVILQQSNISFKSLKAQEPAELSTEEQLAEKLRLAKLQEQADLEVAKDTFGKLAMNVL